MTDKELEKEPIPETEEMDEATQYEESEEMDEATQYEESEEMDEATELEDAEATSNVKRESVAYLEKEKADRLKAFLEYSKISDVLVDYDEISDTYDVHVPSKEFEKAQNLYIVFAQNELKSDDDEPEADSVDVNLYESSTEKYKDNLSSAITFFICGAAGLIILILNDVGILKFLSKDSSSFILMNIVLGALFVGFIAIGFFSLKYSKKIKDHASKEDEAMNKTMDWLKEHVTKEDIENSYSASFPEEMKYFSRSEYVKNALKNEFEDLDEATLDFINDQFLEKMF